MQSNQEYLNPAPDLEAMIMAVSRLSILIFQPRRYRGGEELKCVQQLARAFLLIHPDAFLAYIELAQRVLLTREYRRICGPGHLPRKASDWMQDPKSFGLSATWFKALQKKREADPLYKQTWKGLAEAILELTENFDQGLFTYWSEWLLERNGKREEQLFFKYVTNLTFDL